MTFAEAVGEVDDEGRNGYGGAGIGEQGQLFFRDYTNVQIQASGSNDNGSSGAQGIEP